MFNDIELRAFGLIALAGAASNNLKQRESLQAYIDSGDADDVCAYLGTPPESFMDSVDELAAAVIEASRLRDHCRRLNRT